MKNTGGRGVSLLLGGVVLGYLITGGIRFLTEEPSHGVHLHANWAVFIDGERLDLSGDEYMQEIYVCMADPEHQEPIDRVHMHENNQDIVHVHGPGVTWGQLMTNLDFALGDTFLFTHDAHLENTDSQTLTFVLNGMVVPSVHNRLIGDRDRLLISYGPESPEEVLKTQYPQVATTAIDYDTMPDPASCSGPLDDTLGQRLRRAFWF
ncbi:MAG: hypothetical protein LBG44_06490 [Gemmatimonadota bacterium]|jgi:hypothetical protein|nr:hypothetical protein [Gemmatimonadota bacterium]